MCIRDSPEAGREEAAVSSCPLHRCVQCVLRRPPPLGPRSAHPRRGPQGLEGQGGQAGNPGLHRHTHDEGGGGHQGRAIRARHFRHHRLARGQLAHS
eukprot:320793-Alexandrium_andersonii.AAC.1